MSTDFQQWALENVTRFFAPLTYAADSQEYLSRLLAQLGWDALLLPEDILTAFGDALTLTKSASTALSAPPLTLEEVVAAVELARHLVDSAKAIGDVLTAVPLFEPPDPQKLVKEFVDDLFSLLLLKFLYGSYPNLLFALRLR
jgi:hypothetical protein